MIKVDVRAIDPQQTSFIGGYYVVMNKEEIIMAAFRSQIPMLEYFKNYNPGTWTVGYINV